MKVLTLFLYLALTSVTVIAQQPQSGQNISAQRPEVQLQLSTSVAEQRYTVESGSKLLRLTLQLTYTNAGKRAILLDRKSSLVYRKLVSRNTKAAAARKYIYDEHSHIIGVDSFRAAGFRYDTTPQRSEFVSIEPGKSYSLNKEILLRLSDGTQDTEDFLRPGTYFLQLRVATWYYFVEPDEFSDEWREDGYLWSGNITSLPMAFNIEKRR